MKKHFARNPIVLASLVLAASACNDSSNEPVINEPIKGASLEVPLAVDTTATDEKATGLDYAAQEMMQQLTDKTIYDIDELSDMELDLGDDVLVLSWRDLSMEGEAIEDILDKMLYPDQYEEDEYNLPDYISKLDGQEVAIIGYQIPLEWEGTTVPEFMLVGDLLACCFGGAPMPDEWIEVKMVGKGAEYFPYIPVIVRGKLVISGIEDEAGYAAGCYHIECISVEKEY